jgi:hypothetical protein
MQPTHHIKPRILSRITTATKIATLPKFPRAAPFHPHHQQTRMGSSKGQPTDPELREKIKEEVKAEEKGP